MNAAAPHFSVVIPTHNRAVLLSRTLASVMEQTFHSYEIIVVDDGSTDETTRVLEEYRSKIQVVVTPNSGPAVARNAGAAVARGTYFAFLDSDDLWFPWSLEIYERVLAMHADAAILVGTPYRFRNEMELSAVVRSPVRSEYFADYLASAAEWRWWGASSFVIRREAFEAVGGFCKAWINGEDSDLLLRMGTQGGFVHVVAPAVFAYREHEGSAVSNLERTLDGLWYRINSESSGRYPGGSARRLERWRILGRELRPVSFDCLRAGRRHDAWRLYRASWRWHVTMRAWKYLFGFPFFCIKPL